MIIDDEAKILSAMARVLKVLPETDIELYVSPEKALKRAHTSVFDLFISDYQMPYINGIDLLSQIKLLQPESVRIIVSGRSDKSVLVKAINKAEIFRYIEKPWNNKSLLSDISDALMYRNTLLEKTILSKQIRQKSV